MNIGLYKIKKNLKFIDDTIFTQSFISTKDKSINWSSFLDNIFSKKQISSIAIPLDLVPLSLPNDYIIGALSSRKKTNWVIEIQPDSFDTSKTLNIKSNATIYHPETVNIQLLKEIRSDLIFEISQNTPPKGTNRLTTVNKEINSANIFEILTEEITPPTSSGIIAFIIKKEDISSRKTLMRIHDKTTTAVSNAERKAAIAIAEKKISPYNFHCYRDGNHYKMLAQPIQGSHKVYKHTSSTYLEIDKAIIDLITN